MNKKIKDSFNLKVDVVDAVIEEMCDSFCRYPQEIEDDEELMDICSECPLNRLREED